MNNEEILRVVSRHTLEPILQVMRVAINSRKRQKELKHPKSNLARPPIYEGAYPQKLWTASPGNPVGVTKPSLNLLYVQLDKTSLEESTNLKGTYFLTFFGTKSMRKPRPESKTELTSAAVHIA